MPLAKSWIPANVDFDLSWRPAERLPSPPATLVIGYGNDLRGDDAAGIRAATLLAGEVVGHRSIITQQLMPDLAADIAQAERVVFVDAYPADRDGAPLRVERVPGDSEDGEGWGSPLGHHSDPATLVGLARRLFGATPDAWVVGIPAYCFDAGEVISPQTSFWIDEAVALIEGSAFFRE